jgi:hypothetical protein
MMLLFSFAPAIVLTFVVIGAVVAVVAVIMNRSTRERQTRVMLLARRRLEMEYLDPLSQCTREQWEAAVVETSGRRNVRLLTGVGPSRSQTESRVERWAFWIAVALVGLLVLTVAALMVIPH